MLQRKQTLYLLLAVICMALLYTFNVADILTEDGKLFFGATGLSNNEGAVDNTWALVYQIMVPASLLALVVTIAMFKKLSQQIKLAMLAMLLVLLCVGAAVFLITGVQEVHPEAVAEYGVGFYLPIAAACFIFLGMRGIRGDIKLLKSLDRLR